MADSIGNQVRRRLLASSLASRINAESMLSNSSGTLSTTHLLGSFLGSSGPMTTHTGAAWRS